MARPFKYPELFFGIAGPIGVDMNAIEAALRDQLTAVEYSSHSIKVTDEMMALSADVSHPAEADFYNDIKFKIEYADELCRTYADKATLARVTVRAISRLRASLTPETGEAPRRVAYIIRQLKRPEEVALFRALYRRQFVLISAYGPAVARREFLASKMRRSLSTLTSDTEIACKADELIDVDQNERSKPFGQNLQETFHQGDVFIDGMSKRDMSLMLERFIQALFGRNDITPTKTEYGMYAAASASLRSSDLSRQVGAAIFSADGELITQGCNEVPRAFGGTYWDQEEPDYRDIRIGYDPNEDLKRHILRDLFERLARAGLLSEKILEFGSPSKIVEQVTRKAASPLQSETAHEDGALIGADIMDLTEYGRVVHAEMCVICNAARLGRSIKDTILFCTTFPCHNCTKHIIASGVKRVTYLEPYPKSRAKQLHANEIEIEIASETRVSFLPFLGISPFRYRDIFQKGRRKSRLGEAHKWYQGEPRPLIDIVSPSYLDEEPLVISALFASPPE